MRDFSQNAWRQRAAKRLTQQQVAEMAGISLRQYQELEAGHGQPRLSTAVQIAAVLDIDLNAMRDEAASKDGK